MPTIAPTNTAKPSVNGASATVAERIVATERELVLAALDELKRRGNGELRVSARRDPKGVVELVYIGVHEKADLETLRRLYQQMRKHGAGFVTF